MDLYTSFKSSTPQSEYDDWWDIEHPEEDDVDDVDFDNMDDEYED